MKFEKVYKLSEIAKSLNCEFEGNPEMKVSGINEIHKVTDGDITFVDVPKYYPKALNSAASVVLINQKVNCPEGKGLIFTNHPFDSYNELVVRYKKADSITQSKVTYKAQIGKGTNVQSGVVLAKDVIIGENCLIGANTVIHDGTRIGNNCIVQSNCVIGGDAFYYKKKEAHYDKMISCGSVFIEDFVEIGASCTIDKGVSGETRIGKGTKIDNMVHIGHGVIIGKNCLIAAQCGIGGKTTLEDEVILWGQVGINKDVVIGTKAVIMAQSGISKSLKGGKSYFGSPAKEYRSKLKELAYINQMTNFKD